MFIDAELVLEEAADIAVTGEAAVTKDTGEGGDRAVSQYGESGGASEGHPTYARFTISAAPSAGGIIFHASESDDDVTFTPSKLSRNYDFADLPEGAIIKVEVPPDTKRYIGAGWTSTLVGGVAHVDFFHG